MPLTLTNHSEISAQFGSFTRHFLGMDEAEPEPEQRARFLGSLLTGELIDEPARCNHSGAVRPERTGAPVSMRHGRSTSS